MIGSKKTVVVVLLVLFASMVGTGVARWRAASVRNLNNSRLSRATRCPRLKKQRRRTSGSRGRWGTGETAGEKHSAADAVCGR